MSKLLLIIGLVLAAILLVSATNTAKSHAEATSLADLLDESDAVGLIDLDAEIEAEGLLKVHRKKDKPLSTKAKIAKAQAAAKSTVTALSDQQKTQIASLTKEESQVEADISELDKVLDDADKGKDVKGAKKKIAEISKRNKINQVSVKNPLRLKNPIKLARPFEAAKKELENDLRRQFGPDMLYAPGQTSYQQNPKAPTKLPFRSKDDDMRPVNLEDPMPPYIQHLNLYRDMSKLDHEEAAQTTIRQAKENHKSTANAVVEDIKRMEGKFIEQDGDVDSDDDANDNDDIDADADADDSQDADVDSMDD